MFHTNVSENLDWRLFIRGETKLFFVLIWTLLFAVRILFTGYHDTLEVTTVSIALDVKGSTVIW